MTREEAIEILEERWRYSRTYKYTDAEIREAFDMAIKTLEQADVLDKIRAEIADYGSIWVEYKIAGRSDKDIEQLVSDVLKQAKEQVLDVIDKYKYRKGGAE